MDTAVQQLGIIKWKGLCRLWQSGLEGQDISLASFTKRREENIVPHLPPRNEGKTEKTMSTTPGNFRREFEAVKHRRKTINIKGDKLVATW